VKRFAKVIRLIHYKKRLTGSTSDGATRQAAAGQGDLILIFSVSQGEPA
jgi:hypothetical protein